MKGFDAQTQKIYDCINLYICDALKAGAEECYRILRDRPEITSFFNITGNLRSSLGTAVYDRGRAHFVCQFETIFNGQQGSSKGSSMANSLASQYIDCVALVIMAAEDYASEVEDRDSKDVISSVTAYAEQKVQSWIKQGIDKACREINSWK